MSEGTVAACPQPERCDAIPTVAMLPGIAASRRAIRARTHGMSAVVETRAKSWLDARHQPAYLRSNTLRTVISANPTPEVTSRLPSPDTRKIPAGIGFASRSSFAPSLTRQRTTLLSPRSV